MFNMLTNSFQYVDNFKYYRLAYFHKKIINWKICLNECYVVNSNLFIFFIFKFSDRIEGKRRRLFSQGYD